MAKSARKSLHTLFHRSTIRGTKTVNQAKHLTLRADFAQNLQSGTVICSASILCGLGGLR